MSKTGSTVFISTRATCSGRFVDKRSVVVVVVVVTKGEKVGGGCCVTDDVGNSCVSSVASVGLGESAEVDRLWESFGESIVVLVVNPV